MKFWKHNSDEDVSSDDGSADVKDLYITVHIADINLSSLSMVHSVACVNSRGKSNQ